MTFEQLRIFLAVAQHMHFTRAAEALYLTQPSVSAAIQSLEEEHSVKLFDRIGRRVELTQAGKLLQIEAQKILAQVSLTKRGLEEFNQLQRGELHLGASQTIGNYWIPHFISQFKRQYPGICVNCTLGNTEVIASGTAAGAFDLGLVEGVVEPGIAACLEQQIVGGDQLLIIVGQPHVWFERSVLSLSDLANTAWVMREDGSGTRQIFEQSLHSWGIDPSTLNVILELSSGEMVKAIVETGIGATAISELMVKKELQFGILKALHIRAQGKAAIRSSKEAAGNPMQRPFTLLKHRERFQTRIAQAFEHLLTSQHETD